MILAAGKLAVLVFYLFDKISKSILYNIIVAKESPKLEKGKLNYGKKKNQLVS